MEYSKATRFGVCFYKRRVSIANRSKGREGKSVGMSWVTQVGILKDPEQPTCFQ